MTTVFIAGSRHIKHLDRKVKERIDNIVSSDLNVIVGDSDGVDASVQSYLAEKSARKVVVYCSGDRPRNNIGDWPICKVDTDLSPGSRAFFTAKDIKMAETGDYGLMIWDTKSTGTLSNVIELLKRKKKTVVFINKDKNFKTVSDIQNFEDLVMVMSESARIKADQKIKLFHSINILRSEQFDLF